MKHNLPMSGDQGNSHPARKIDHRELKKTLAEYNQKVPAVRSNVIAQEFSDVDPQTIRNNLDDLADSKDICRFNDGDSKFYWFPRNNDERGSVEYSEIVDDSVDWEEIDTSKVPTNIAEEIATNRLPYYRPRSFWSKIINFCQFGVMAAFGLVILGLGGIVDGTLGMNQEMGVILFNNGLRLSLVFLIGYVVSLGLDHLASEERIPKSPSYFNIFNK